MNLEHGQLKWSGENRPQENKADNKKQTLSTAVLSRGKIGFAGLGIGTGEPGGRNTPWEIGDKAPEENKHLIKW